MGHTTALSGERGVGKSRTAATIVKRLGALNTSCDSAGLSQVDPDGGPIVSVIALVSKSRAAVNVYLSSLADAGALDSTIVVATYGVCARSG